MAEDIIDINISESGDEVSIQITDGGDDVTIVIDEAAGTPIPPLTDLLLVVDRGEHISDPVAGIQQIDLPLVWQGKRIRVARNGRLFTRYTRTSTGILLLEGDECETEEEFVFSNY